MTNDTRSKLQPLSIDRQANQLDYTSTPKQNTNKPKDGFFAPECAQ